MSFPKSLFVFLIFVQNIFGSPNGAPREACLDLTPKHGVLSQETPSYHDFTVFHDNVGENHTECNSEE